MDHNRALESILNATLAFHNRVRAGGMAPTLGREE
jgi:hypothetical protein